MYVSLFLLLDAGCDSSLETKGHFWSEVSRNYPSPFFVSCGQEQMHVMHVIDSACMYVVSYYRTYNITPRNENVGRT